jgi:hypothetical protein
MQKRSHSLAQPGSGEWHDSPRISGDEASSLEIAVHRNRRSTAQGKITVLCTRAGFPARLEYRLERRRPLPLGAGNWFAVQRLVGGAERIRNVGLLCAFALRK